ncbi:hypothetical protein PaecuDRAFT_4240 [Paenibacillus curdlanolyticus YK9]|uniref:Uncharacterized protein n=1 Tax=Paenibacillus curdlanolyticus YK9 TaxID=717606 RepID=E0IEZ9_9BACL|nr:hypothetical protein PaecuDRAFT_4240 [Paenibacillus curdlanolyticus YK9]
MEHDTRHICCGHKGKSQRCECRGMLGHKTRSSCVTRMNHHQVIYVINVIYFLFIFWSIKEYGVRCTILLLGDNLIRARGKMQNVRCGRVSDVQARGLTRTRFSLFSVRVARSPLARNERFRRTGDAEALGYGQKDAKGARGPCWAYIPQAAYHMPPASAANGLR